MGTGLAADRGFSGKHLYGHESCRSGSGLDRADIQVEPAAVTVGLGLVATLVYSASFGASLKRWARLKPLDWANVIPICSNEERLQKWKASKRWPSRALGW